MDTKDVWFATLGVTVRGNEVTEYTFRKPHYRVLGSLEGARAEVTDGTRSHSVTGAAAGAALVGPVGLAAGVRKKRAAAFVIFADGTFHEAKLTGNAAIRRAQEDAVRFNALAQGPSRDGRPEEAPRTERHSPKLPPLPGGGRHTTDQVEEFYRQQSGSLPVPGWSCSQGHTYTGDVWPNDLCPVDGLPILRNDSTQENPPARESRDYRLHTVKRDRKGGTKS